LDTIPAFKIGCILLTRLLNQAQLRTDPQRRISLDPPPTFVRKSNLLGVTSDVN
jgi:hypothetical protein